MIKCRTHVRPMIIDTYAIKDYVFALYKKLEGKRGSRKKIIKEVKELYGTTISRETVRRIVEEGARYS